MEGAEVVHDTVVPQKMGASISAEPRLALVVRMNRAEIGECGGRDVVAVLQRFGLDFTEGECGHVVRMNQLSSGVLYWTQSWVMPRWDR